MFGVGADAGKTTIRLRHAYAQWGELLAGQTNSVFMDGDSFPNVIDYWGPTGMIFLRNPGGISHHPDEAVDADDVASALRAGLNFLDHFQGHLQQLRESESKSCTT